MLTKSGTDSTRCGHFAGPAAALAVGLSALLLGGCAGSLPRFDFPVFGLTDSKKQNATAANRGAPQEKLADSKSVYGYVQSQPRGTGIATAGGAPAAGRMALGRDPAASRAGDTGAAARGSEAYRAGKVAEASPRPGKSAGGTTAAGKAEAKPADGRTVVEVKPGDTLMAVAERHKVPISLLMSANRLSSLEVRPGQTLVIPETRRAKAAGR